MSRPSERYAEKPPARVRGQAGEPAPHDSATLHVTGRAVYIDDIVEPTGTLHAALFGAPHAHARIRRMDLDAVRALPGVHAVLSAADIPGDGDIGAVFPGDPLFADDIVSFHGQPVFAVVADDFRTAHEALAAAEIEFEPLAPLLDVETALERREFVTESHTMARGDVAEALIAAPVRLEGRLAIGGQEHFYLEGQIAMARIDDDGVFVWSSTQHPHEVQALVARVLDLPMHSVTVQTRRMGGGFGGKETQAAFVACTAALAAHVTGFPVKLRLPRRDDMVMTGKRHDFVARWRAGCGGDGVIEALDIELLGKCGFSPDLSDGIVDRAMFHADNAYFLPAAKVVGHRCRTHTVSNTAFRGFGGPQGVLAIEAVIDDIARQTNLDPLTVRKRNLYRPGRDVTHYGQPIEQHILPDLIETLEASADYWARREAITRFNATTAGDIRRGLALTPVKFGISFTTTHLNQAGALVLVYTDGTIQLNHGGTEMGQGLFVKVAQVVARMFGVDLSRVKVTASRTDKVPNASPTAASAGSDLNGMAAADACRKLLAGFKAFAARHFGVDEADITFADDHVHAGQTSLTFAEFAALAHRHRIPLFSSGYYATPKIHYDRDKAWGRPFFYFAHGAAVSEVRVDTATGEYKVDRVDILHDVGASLNEAVDIGQIEGGFAQGMGWLTTEELVWNDDGRLVSDGPATYKIPTAFDMPADFRVALYANDNVEPTIYRSKAVGEPPLMLGTSVWCALRDACASLADYRMSPPLDAPATPERVLTCAQAARRAANEAV